MATATTLLVLGRGVVPVAGRYELSPGSAARVRAAVEYARRHWGDAPGAVAVFAGGWAGAAEGAPAPPERYREGALMLAAARAAGLAGLAELRAETRSRSTLENLLHVAEQRLLGDGPYTAARPLGIVSHAWHLPRVRDLAGKVLALRGAALLDVPVAGDGPEGPRGWALLRLGSRLCFAGATSPPALRRRERLVVAAARAARR
ncbi:ElyC/SanA/YdcF family protein [Dactylosporangium sp. CA-139066]|uniref:ElyC/SanA/YdcF family protein n=1 Tax=Dactylosporangium sp. CA-139066 TaxID=3239930 RepID=UPI003D8ECD58